MKLPTFSAETSLSPWQMSYTGHSRLITGGAHIQMMDDFSNCVGKSVNPKFVLTETGDKILKTCGHDLQCWKNALDSWGSWKDRDYNRQQLRVCYLYFVGNPDVPPPT